MKVKVEVFLKEGILDPQGKAILNASHALGYEEIQEVRAGKVFLLEISGEDERAVIEKAQRLGKTLLSNPVIEAIEVDVLL